MGIPKVAKVRLLLEVTKALDNAIHAINNMGDSIKAMPGVPKGFMDNFKKLANPGDLVELLVPIYERHLSESDLDILINFLTSDVGSRWTSLQPAIMAEAMKAGDEWGQRIGHQAMMQCLKENKE